MSKYPKVLIVAAECAPFAKTGGLADVVGTLPGELRKIGLDVRVMLPFHSQIKSQYASQTEHLCNFYVRLGWRSQYVGIERLEFHGITYYFVDNEYYFGGPIYKGGTEEGEQYSFFTRAILEALPLLNYYPDIIHANDWHTAMIPMLIKTQYQSRPQGKIKTVFTMHNLCYQGKFSQDFVMDMLGIPGEYFSYRFLEAYGCANFLKGALVFADKLTTVSPTYAREIIYPAFSEGMEGVLAQRRNDLVGILNGIDTVEFDPQNDPHIVASFSKDALDGKRADKQALISQVGLSISEDTPLIGMVSRLTSQKGLDLVKCILDELVSTEDLGIVVLGSGDAEYENFFREAAYRHCGRIAVRTEYNNQLAHQIYAGADFFLMPSKFEPCGISQMIALRYGTLPIVRETGGLADTVKPYNEFTGEGTGFSFTNYNAHDMLYVIRLALRVYADNAVMNRLIRQAMSEDNSFASSAKEYAKLYESLV